MLLQACGASALTSRLSHIMGAMLLVAAAGAPCLARNTQGHQGYLFVAYNM
jgi:hypothetical protein